MMQYSLYLSEFVLGGIMLTTIKGILKGDKILLEEDIPFRDEQNILLTLLDRTGIDEKDFIIKGIQDGLDDRKKQNMLTFDESFDQLEKLIEL
jgi:hypothetical protein